MVFWQILLLLLWHIWLIGRREEIHAEIHAVVLLILVILDSSRRGGSCGCLRIPVVYRGVEGVGAHVDERVLLIDEIVVLQHH